MRFGLQMWGLNPVFLANKEEFLTRMNKAGYRYLEPCVAAEPICGIEEHLWLPEDLEKNLPLLEKHGFMVHSVHLLGVSLTKNVQTLIALLQKYGISQAVLPCPAFASAAEGAQLLPLYRAAKETFAAGGIDLLLHNGKDDSVQRVQGVSAYEWLLRESGLSAQPDTGWLLYGGTDPEEFLWKYESQVKSLHYKDFDSENREVGIGLGRTDMMAVFQFARYREVIQLADQDGSEDFLADMERVGGLLQGLQDKRENTDSILCTLDTYTGEVTELKRFPYIMEAPNWYQQDPNYLYYNADGSIFRYHIPTGQSQKLDSGHCTNCNNDHVLSADGTEIAVSHSEVSWFSQVYIVPIGGGEPRLITPNFPSFLHGWSPDGKELAYCAFRDHGRGTEVDIYAISRDGGEERRLTENAGFNDGPEYSPDGRKILFISSRSGLMQNWVMNRDGSNQKQLTFSQRNNWFGHYSPDGRKIVYLSYSKEGLDPSQHLPNMVVRLQLMEADGPEDRTILEFFGGQGSINVNSWHPDSRHFAFVKYELHHK